MLIDLLASIVVLYVVVDPIGNIPLFIAVTSKLDAARRQKVLMTSVAVATTVLALFAVFGISFIILGLVLATLWLQAVLFSPRFRYTTF